MVGTLVQLTGVA